MSSTRRPSASTIRYEILTEIWGYSGIPDGYFGAQLMANLSSEPYRGNPEAEDDFVESSQTLSQTIFVHDSQGRTAAAEGEAAAAAEATGAWSLPPRTGQFGGAVAMGSDEGRAILKAAPSCGSQQVGSLPRRFLPDGAPPILACIPLPA